MVAENKHESKTSDCEGGLSELLSRVKELEKENVKIKGVVGTLIVWLVAELGEKSVLKLIDDLKS